MPHPDDKRRRPPKPKTRPPTPKSKRPSAVNTPSPSGKTATPTRARTPAPTKKLAVECPDHAELGDNVVTLEETNANTFWVTLDEVGANPSFRARFFVEGDPNYWRYALREPLPGVTLREGHKVLVEIKPQTYQGQHVEVLLRVYDSDMQLVSHCALFGAKFIRNKMEYVGTDIGELEQITCDNVLGRRLDALPQAQANASDLPLVLIDVRNITADDIVSVRQDTLASYNRSRAQGAGRGLQTATAARLRRGLELARPGTNAMQDIALSIFALAAFFATLLQVRRMRNANKPKPPST